MSDTAEFKATLTRYLKARIPFISIRSTERARVLDILRDVAGALNAPFYVHTLSQGTRELSTGRIVNEDRSVVGAVDFASQQMAQRRILVGVQPRDAVLQQQVAGHQIWRYLQEHPETKLYQMGLEDSLYYAPRATWGDIFGPWRYRDYQNLAPQPLHHKLRSEGFTALVIHTGRVPTVAQQPEFLQYFELVLVDGEVRLYRLRPGFLSLSMLPNVNHKRALNLARIDSSSL